MDYREFFPDPEREIILHVEIYSSRELGMQVLEVDHLRVPRWEGLPENPICFRDRRNPTPTPDAGKHSFFFI